MSAKTRIVLLCLLGLLLVPAATASAGVEPRVVGGSTTSSAAYPWQAALVIAPAKYGGNAYQRQFCGGSLLTPSIVVSAAHCVYDTDPDCGPFLGKLPCTPLTDPGGDGTKRLDGDDVDVVLGRTTLSSSAGSEHSLHTGPGAVSYQANYNPNTIRNDVSYLALASPSSQQTIQIAGADEGALWDPGSLEEISGWGATSESGSAGSDTLLAATVPIVSDSSCGAAYGSDFDPVTMVCAGYPGGGVDTCYGDSGGPLEAPTEGGGYRLVGITSWGYGCAEPGYPGVYTRVAADPLRAAIVVNVAALETLFGLPHQSVVGSGAKPRTAPLSTPASQPAAAPRDRFAKCRRLHSKKKRKRCIRKQKRL